MAFMQHEGTPSPRERWRGADGYSRVSDDYSGSMNASVHSTDGSSHPLFMHSRELLGGLAGKGRAQAAKSNKKLASLTETFRDENPRLYGLLYDICDAIAYVGWDNPFGFSRSEWLSATFLCLIAAIALLVPAVVGLSLGSKAQLQDVAWATNGAYSNGLWMTPAGYTTNAFAPADLDRLSYSARDHYQLGSLGDPVLINGELVYGYDPSAGRSPQVYPPGFDRPGFYTYDRPQRRRATTSFAFPNDNGTAAEAAGARTTTLDHSVAVASEQKNHPKADSSLRGSSRSPSIGANGESRELGWMQDDELEEHLIDGSGQAPGHRTVIVSWAACAWGFGAVDNVQDPLRVRERYVKYMAWAGFLEPATHVEMGGDWPQVCRACANTKWATVALVTWSLLAALLELRWLRLRLDPKRDTSGDKTIVCLWGSLAGLLATACMGSAFTHGCLDAVSTVGGVGRGAGLGPGLWCAAVSAILRGIGFILQLSLRAGAPTPPPDFQELPPRRGNARVDPRGVYQRVQSGAGKAMRRGYAMGNKVASHSSAAVWGAKSGSDGNGGGGNSSHRPEHLNQKEEEELRMDHGEAHNYQSFVEYYGSEADEKWALAERVPMTHLQASAPSDLWTGEYRAYDHPNSGDDGDGFVSSSESELDDDSSGSENSDDENEGQAAAADAGPEEEEQELRYDTDGSMHSFSAFTEYYGPEEGARLWEFAAVARPASAASSSSLQPKRDKQPHHSHRRSSQRSHNGSRPSHSSGSSMRNSSQMEPPWSRFVAMQTTGKAPLDDRDPRIAAAFQSFLEAEAEANALREKEQGRAQVAALGQALETRRVKSTLSQTGWRNEVKDPSTGKWVEDTKAFRQQRLLLHANNSSSSKSFSPPPKGNNTSSTRLSPASTSPSPKKHSAEASVSWGDLSAVRNSSSPSGAAGSFSQWETPRGGDTEVPRSSPRSSPRNLNNASISSSSSAAAAAARANAKAQFEGLNEQQTADLKAAWNKILGFLARDKEAPLKFVKFFKEAQAKEAATSDQSTSNSSGNSSSSSSAGVPLERLVRALRDMGVDLAHSEALVWLERQDTDGSGTISLPELSHAIATAAQMKQAMA